MNHILKKGALSAQTSHHQIAEQLTQLGWEKIAQQKETISRMTKKIQDHNHLAYLKPQLGNTK